MSASIESPIALGPLERRVMEIMWDRGDSTVRDLMPYAGVGAYTTLMTTMVRLHEKGLLECPTKRGRGFVYRPKVTREAWGKMLIRHFLDSYRAESLNPDMLISCLVDAMGAEDESLLEELERKIKAKRDDLRSDRSGAKSPG